MRTVCLSLAWLKQELQNAGLRLEDEAPAEDVRAFRCEPWFLVEYKELGWIVEGEFATCAVLVRESDGTEVLRRSVQGAVQRAAKRARAAEDNHTSTRNSKEDTYDGDCDAIADACSHVLDDIVKFFELRLGAPLRRKPPCAVKTMREIAAELEAGEAAARLLGQLSGR